MRGAYFRWRAGESAPGAAGWWRWRRTPLPLGLYAEAMHSRCITGLLLFVLSLACTSPREKDCKAVLPGVESAKQARGFLIAPDAGTGQRFAEPHRRAAAELRAIALADPLMKSPVTALADATDRLAKVMAAIEELTNSLKLRPEGPSMLGPILDGAGPPVERLATRCGLFAPSEAQRALPDCQGLGRALESCLTPQTDETTAEELVMTCAKSVEGVRSDDPAAGESIRQIASTIRDLEPVARSIGIPAKELVQLIIKLTKRASEQSAARHEAEQAEAQLRALCPVR